MTASERLLNYVKFDTMSDETSETCPSTAKQLKLGEYIVNEMKEMGISDAYMDADGYVYGTVPGDPAMPTIGLIAHMDTSPACSGANINPRIIEYKGGDIALNETTVMRAAEYPSLKRSIGKHLIVTDGTTLLGADDKAGIAEILTACEMLMASGEKHATIKIGFTPDEEIGRGADRFNIPAFGADWAYTCDGAGLGEYEYENFNAASAVVTVNGFSIHPGSAKNKLVNSMLVAMEFNSLLPVHERPEATEGYEGFAMLNGIEGEIEKTVMQYIIRDHDMDKFNARKDKFNMIARFLNEKYGDGTVEVLLRDSYYNMKEKVAPYMFIIDQAIEAMRMAGIEPYTAPIRGGTDGARLSYDGLICPNLCTGGENFHGKFEYIPVEDMDTCSQILVNLAKIAKKPE